MSSLKFLKGDSSRIPLDATPFHDGWFYYTSDDGCLYIDSEDNEIQKRTRINTKSEAVSCVLYADQWDDGKQIITVNGLGAEQNGIIGVAHGITDEQLSAVCAAKLYIHAQNADSLTISATGVIPSCDIPVVVIMMD